MDLYKIPALIGLGLSSLVAAWLVIRPDAARLYFAQGFERQATPLHQAVGRFLRRTPSWAVSLWGGLAICIEVVIAACIVFVVN